MITSIFKKKFCGRSLIINIPEPNASDEEDKAVIDTVLDNSKLKPGISYVIDKL